MAELGVIEIYSCYRVSSKGGYVCSILWLFRHSFCPVAFLSAFRMHTFTVK